MLNSTVVAISAFKSDKPIINLLSDIFNDFHDSISRVVVVDSLGSGEIESVCSINGWPVGYYNFHYNLGSAGNLAKRIEIASQLEARWCLCLNHDANWDSGRLSAMLNAANTQSKVGAVYPVLDHYPRQPRWEDGRRSFAPSAGARFPKIPLEDSSEVLWSSSNGALYSTEPFKENIRVMSDLWMGYEDLAYGLALNQNGWKQLVCRKAVLSKVFDYSALSLPVHGVFIQDKPDWYSYYNMRNLVIIHNEYGSQGISFKALVFKFFHSGLRILLLESNRFSKLALHFRGTVDGFRGRVGKYDVP
jgi:GT2 family glycosyltransferase